MLQAPRYLNPALIICTLLGAEQMRAYVSRTYDQSAWTAK